jgi:hypothetical protein
MIRPTKDTGCGGRKGTRRFEAEVRRTTTMKMQAFVDRTPTVGLKTVNALVDGTATRRPGQPRIVTDFRPEPTDEPASPW